MSQTCKNGHINPPRNPAGACRICVAAYQRWYRKDYKSRNSLRMQRKRKEHKKRAIDYLGGKCTDCGNPDDRVLVFDHLRDKKTNIARILGKSWACIQKELDKCELVCANCHLIRTNSRLPEIEDVFIPRRGQKTHCNHGHPWTEENAYRDKHGRRTCLICKRKQAQESYWRCKKQKQSS